MHDHETMSDVIISLGSNVERERHIPEAIRLIRRNRNIDVHKVSRFFESDSVGGPISATPPGSSANSARNSSRPITSWL